MRFETTSYSNCICTDYISHPQHRLLKSELHLVAPPPPTVRGEAKSTMCRYPPTTSFIITSAYQMNLTGALRQPTYHRPEETESAMPGEGKGGGRLSVPQNTWRFSKFNHHKTYFAHSAPRLCVAELDLLGRSCGHPDTLHLAIL